jgi:hypothetical protein
MMFGAFLSVASIGWIAGVVLVATWIRSGFPHALFWFGLTLLLGAGMFAIGLVIGLLAAIVKFSTKESLGDPLAAFAWALFYNLTLGVFAVYLSLRLGA